MRPRLKPIDQQVIVITGASSGIGLETVRQAAERGARVILAARNEGALSEICAELRGEACECSYVVADVGNIDDVRRIADAAIRNFGGFDTWVNNAGVSIYGELRKVPLDDMHRVIQTNFWGTVHGSMIAAEHLRDHGGAIINIGSTVSDWPLPLQGIYTASKYAIKGFTDVLRLELQKEGAPVSVTLIKPASTDTPYTSHAKNLMEVEPKFPPPVYHPDVVARAILHAAQCPVRQLSIGTRTRLLAGLSSVAPRLADRLIRGMTFRGQKSKRPAISGDEGLYRPGHGGHARGGHAGRVRRRSVYATVSMHPLITTALVVGVGVGLLSLLPGPRAAAVSMVPRNIRKRPIKTMRKALGMRRRGVLPEAWSSAMGIGTAMGLRSKRGAATRLRRALRDAMDRVIDRVRELPSNLSSNLSHLSSSLSNTPASVSRTMGRWAETAGGVVRTGKVSAGDDEYELPD